MRCNPAGREVEHDTTRKAVKSDKINVLMVEETIMARGLLATHYGSKGFADLVGATSNGRSTNHPERLESALALWSGRIDQATDVPCPKSGVAPSSSCFTRVDSN